MNLKLLLDKLMAKLGYFPIQATLEVKKCSCNKILIRAEKQLDPYFMIQCDPLSYKLSIQNQLKEELINGADADGLIEWIATESPDKSDCKLEGRLIVGEYPKSKHDHLTWLLDFNNAFSKSRFQ